jgi:hypothetical protein
MPTLNAFSAGTGMGANVDKCTNFYGLKDLFRPMTLLIITVTMIKMLIRLALSSLIKLNSLFCLKQCCKNLRFLLIFLSFSGSQVFQVFSSFHIEFMLAEFFSVFLPIFSLFCQFSELITADSFMPMLSFATMV